LSSTAVDSKRPEATWVDTPEGLDDVVSAVAGRPWVALDTEFIRERTYYGHLCLLQIGWGDGIALIDTIALSDLSPLIPLFEDPSTTKILHAAVQDMQLFLERFDTLPKPVFDSQVAAAFLGYGEQIGYGDLVRGVLGISLDKGPSRTDWSRRPLSDRQLVYAADDVRYLGAVYTRLVKELQEKGREGWLEEPFAALEQTGRYVVVPERAYTRVKGIHRLDERSFRTAVRLAMWREARAQHADRPRQWVLKDGLLVSLAKLRPRTDDEMLRIQGMSEGLVRRQGKTLRAIFDDDANTPPYERRKGKPGKTSFRSDPNRGAIVDLMMAVVRDVALREGIPTSTLASRDDLERLAAGVEVPRLNASWRKPLLADRLQALLEGRASLAVVNGALEISPRAPGDSV
jgi:ribonuclease D